MHVYKFDADLYGVYKIDADHNIMVALIRNVCIHTYIHIYVYKFDADLLWCMYAWKYVYMYV